MQGSPIGELLPKLAPGVGIATIVPLRQHDKKASLLLLSKMGKAKRLSLGVLQCALFSIDFAAAQMCMCGMPASCDAQAERNRPYTAAEIAALVCNGQQYRECTLACRSLRQGTSILKLKQGDSLCFASLCSDDDAIVVACSEGKVIMMPAGQLPKQARTASGVIAKKLSKGVHPNQRIETFLEYTVQPRAAVANCSSWIHLESIGNCLKVVCFFQCGAAHLAWLFAGKHVVGATVVPQSSVEASTKGAGPWLLMATASGLGKRVALSEFKLGSRGLLGVFCTKLTAGDKLVSLTSVDASEEKEEEDCLVSTSGGMMSRTPVNGFSVVGRTARGVRVIRLQEGDKLASVTPCRYRHYSTES
jgi:DNA gyrase/topoisomerase IV subunit A